MMSASPEANSAEAARWFPAVDRRAGIRLVVALALLLTPWPRVGRAFAAIFSGYANGVTIVLGLGGEARPRFSRPAPGRASAEDGGEWAVRLAPGDTSEAEAPGLLLDTRIFGYTPLAVLLALAAASRLPARRRLWVFGFASACLLLRTGLAIALPVARAFSASRTGWAFGGLAEITWFALLTPPVMSYATPFAAWWLGFALTTPRAAAPRGGSRSRHGRRSFHRRPRSASS